MSKEFVIDTTNFNRAVRELSKISGKDYVTVMRSEAAAVAKSAATKTKKATQKKVAASAAKYYGSRDFFNSGVVTINNGSKKAGTEGRIWVIKGGKKYNINGQFRFPDALWNQLLSAYTQAMSGRLDEASLKKKIETFVKAKKKAVNLAKQSFGMLAERASKSYKMPNAQANAKARTGNKFDPNSYQFFKPVQNVQYLEEGKENFVITLINASKAANNKNAKGGAALQQALDGRAKFFDMNLKKGVFNDAAERTKRYGFYAA